MWTAYNMDQTSILIGLLMAIPLLGFLGIVGVAAESIRKERRKCKVRRNTDAFRKGFRAGIDFADGLIELPQEIVTWPDALKEIEKHDY